MVAASSDYKQAERHQKSKERLSPKAYELYAPKEPALKGIQAFHSKKMGENRLIFKVEMAVKQGWQDKTTCTVIPQPSIYFNNP